MNILTAYCLKVKNEITVWYLKLVHKYVTFFISKVLFWSGGEGVVRMAYEQSHYYTSELDMLLSSIPTAWTGTIIPIL